MPIALLQDARRRQRLRAARPARRPPAPDAAARPRHRRPPYRRRFRPVDDVLERSDDPGCVARLPHLEQRRLARRSNAATAPAASPRGWCATARQKRRASASTAPPASIVDRLPARWPPRARHGPARFRAGDDSAARGELAAELPGVAGASAAIALRRGVGGQSACAGESSMTSAARRSRASVRVLQAVGPVPGRRQRRLRADHRARHDRAARLRARRRRNAGLRQRRLRGGRDPGPPGPGRSARGRAPAGRPARHHLARRRCAGAHGRAGDIRIRRGVAA